MRNGRLRLGDAQDLTIRLAQQGNLAAFNTLVLAYQAQAYSAAYRILGEADAATDVTQDSLVKAYHKLAQYKGGSFLAWLLRIVVNTCFDLLRFRKRHPSSSLDGAGARAECDDYCLGAQDGSPEAFVLHQELRGSIQAALTRLPSDQRVVVVLRDIEGLTYEDIAISTGMRIGTVKSRLSRGRARLRDLLRVDGCPSKTSSHPDVSGPGWPLDARADNRLKSRASADQPIRRFVRRSSGQQEASNELGRERVRELATLERVPAG